jgi:hypothetical protein
MNTAVTRWRDVRGAGRTALQHGIAIHRASLEWVRSAMAALGQTSSVRRPGARREWMARLKLVLAASAIRGEYLKFNSEMQEALAHKPLDHPFKDVAALTVKIRRNCPVQ